MKEIHAEALAKAVNGTILSGAGDTLITSVSTNSKEITKGALFVPIVGERVDAHNFIDMAFYKADIALSDRFNDILLQIEHRNGNEQQAVNAVKSLHHSVHIGIVSHTDGKSLRFKLRFLSAVTHKSEDVFIRSELFEMLQSKTAVFSCCACYHNIHSEPPYLMLFPSIFASIVLPVPSTIPRSVQPIVENVRYHWIGFGFISGDAPDVISKTVSFFGASKP